MFAKMLIAWAAIVMCLSLQAQSQYDPLASDIFTMPGEMRRTSSPDTQIVYIDPNKDPLSIDTLMRPLDPEHTTEYLNAISGRQYLGPFVASQEDLRGIWNLDLMGGTPGKVDLLLVQNRDAVFGRGTLSLAGYTVPISASGQAVKDVLYLDLVNTEDLMLYRCTLTISKDFLSGSFNAFDSQSQVWSGTAQGSRSA
ncbi:MAG: hypothetical protein JW999_01300 [Methanotrichaceae archaeon]|nr:hypothetical protein [Methanotrichaceae archaeon]